MISKYLLICAIIVEQSMLLHVPPMCNFINRTNQDEFSCIDNKRNNITEECFKTKFCSKTNNFELKSLPECPEGFSNAKEFCYTLSKASIFPPNCPFSNTLPFDSYKHVIDEESLGPVWMPVQRNLTNGIGFLQWTEYSGLYKTVFEDYFFFEGGIKNKNCLVYYNSSYIVAVSCLEIHQGVCAYAKQNRKQGTLCEAFGNCVSSTLNAKSKCICLETSPNTTYHKAEFLSPYQNNIYKLLTNETCEIGLEKSSNGTLVWTRSRQEIDYSFWSPEAVFVDTKFYVVSSPTGWLLSEQPLSCSLVERDLPEVFPTVTLTLTYNTDFNFVLNIYSSNEINPNLSIYCFTDANSSTLLYRYVNLTLIFQNNTQTVYQFQPLSTGSGNYWCEGFTSFEANAVTSNVLSFKTDAFIETIHMKYNESIIPLNPEIIDLLKEHLVNSYCPYRLIKINGLDEDKRHVSINVGFECSRANSTTTHLPFEMNPVNFEIFSLLAAGCPEIMENGLTWPETVIGEITNPKEYCFKVDGGRLTRRCGEDAQWEDVTESCEFPEKSSVTDALLSLISSTEANILPQLYEVLNASALFSPFDVYLTSEFLSTINSGNISKDALCTIVDNILNVDSKVLLESQVQFHATDVWLGKIPEYKFWCFDPSVLVKTNFAYHCYDVFVRHFVYVLNTGDERTVSYSDGYNVTEILSKENLESCISFFSTATMDSRYMAIFFNSGLFPDELSKYIQDIYLVYDPGFQLPNYNIYYKFTPDQLAYNVKCVFWNTNLSSSSWAVGGYFTLHEYYFSCEFSRTGNVALAVIPPDAVMQSLSDILASDAPSFEIISRLVQVSSRFNEFAPIDVFLSAEILKRVSAETVNLEHLTQIINNIQHVPRDILVESQKLYMATDSLLYYTDVLVEKQVYTSDFSSVLDNFLPLILNCNNFNGLILFDNNTYLVLNDSLDVSNYLTYENLTSALILSPELKAQICQNSTFIINIYLNDVLFNENTTIINETASIIFDVILHEFEGNFSGPISTFHKIDSQMKYENACVYWKYDVPHSIPGFWKRDNATKTLSTLVQCDFWHATHFGSLLLGADEGRYTETEQIILQWITNINCVLSLIGFSGIILKAVLSKTWWKDIKTKILLFFTVSGIFQIVVFLISDNIDEYLKIYALCVISGVVVHYSVLVQFCWTFLMALFQFRVSVLGKEYDFEHVIKKSTMFVVSLPLLIVLIVLGLDSDSYVKSKSGICYPTDSALYVGVWWPISTILVFNLVTCCFVYNAIRQDRRVQRTAFLFFLLGLTWIFGFIAEISVSVVFVFLFDFLATSQGVILFFIYVGRDLILLKNKNQKKTNKQLH